MRGKLVEHDPHDEPAVELLKRIQSNRTRLGKKRKANSPVVDAGGQRLELFPLPRTWLWCRLAEVGALVGGGTPPSSDEVSAKTVASLPFPLPPLAEQRLIVAKVDELMALCDQLEVAQAERERGRDRLAAASLNRLNHTSAEAPAFCEHARFHLHRLGRLVTRPGHVGQLRQTMLNLAVRGKLVAQDLNDEPASELLERVSAERSRPLREGRIKRLPHVGLIATEERPCEPPAGWAWARIGDLLVEDSQNG